MCFAVPYKVLRISDRIALIEGNKKVKLCKELSRVEIGDYLRIVGDIAVDVLPKNQGLKIRKLIKKLNKLN